MKFALVSHVMPPSWSGQAMMLARLLRGFNSAEYCLISAHPRADGAAAFARTLGGRFYHVPHETYFNRGYRYGLQFVREAINFLPGVRARARRIAQIVESEKCEAIVACSGDLEDLPAAWLASRRLGLPFYPYMFDYYSHQFIPAEKRLLAQLVEPLFIRRAVGIITTNEVLSDHLRRRYGVESTVVHNPCDLTEYEKLLDLHLQKETDKQRKAEVKIVYTGAIYDAHFDAFTNLLRAIEIIGREELKVHVYTAQSPAELEAKGLGGPTIFHEHLPASAMPSVHRVADILFLPLAFNSLYPILVKTSATSKFGEYLAAGRPILVHAPPDSFVSWYVRRHECGLVVDDNDASTLAVAIQRLLEDSELRKRLVTNAWERARADFDVVTARARFAELLNLELKNENSLGLA
jgi:glycosyltransferase involved in cell wall biosynthesis